MRHRDTATDTTSEQLPSEVKAFWEDLKRLACSDQGHRSEIAILGVCPRCKTSEIVVNHQCLCGEVIVQNSDLIDAGERICFWCSGRF